MWAPAWPPPRRGNSYTAYGTIARQSGGRRLIAAFDPAEPTVPGAPRITAARDGSTTELAISLSEDGGSPVTSFEVYRAAEGESEELLATLDGSARLFVDTAAAAGTTYTYRVAAVNALGDSCGTNAVEVAPAGPSCSTPGIRVVSDASGDQLGAPLDEDMDIEWIALSEPDLGGSDKLVFTMKVASLASFPPDRMWRILWEYPDAPVAPHPTPTSTFAGRYYIGMTTDGAGVPSFEYGAVVDLTAVVINFLPPERLGAADAESTYDPDGTITMVVSNDKVGGPGPGDLIGGLVGRTYTVRQDQTLRSDTAADLTASAETYRLSGNGRCPAPPSDCLEDDDEAIEYDNGWHRVESASASGGHFTFEPGRNPHSGMRLEFEVAGSAGALVYEYGLSRQGGTADVYLDGVFQETIDYSGSTNKMRDPELGLSRRYEGLSAGAHVFELRNVVGAVYVDRLCVENGSSEAVAASGPGETTTDFEILAAGTSVLQSVDVPVGSEALALVASSDDGLPIRLVLIDPAGGVLETVDSSDGVAVVERSVSAAGLYRMQVVNLSLDPAGVWTAATPRVER